MNKKSFLTLHRITGILLPVFAGVIAVAYFLALKFDFDSNISHFAKGSPAFAIFTVVAVVSVILSAIIALCARKEMAVTSAPGVGPVSLFGGILSVFVGVGLLITELKAGRADIKAARETVGRIPPILVMQIVGSVLVVFVSVAIVLYCVDSMRGKTAHRISAVLAPLSINLTMFAYYFDFEQPLNGPIRNVTTVVQCAVLLFLLSEMRFAFGSRITSAFCIFSTAVTVPLAMGFSLGGILFKIVQTGGVYPGESFLRMGLYVAVGCIAVDRFRWVRKAIEPDEEPASEDDSTTAD